MSKKFMSRALTLLVLLAIPLFASGCAAFGNSYHSVRQHALDDHTFLQLHESQANNIMTTTAHDNYVRLDLFVCNDTAKRPVQGGSVCRRDGWPGPGHIWIIPSSLDELEVRASDQGDRVWIVDKGLNRVIASLDRPRNSLTGIDDPLPAWAKADGGRIVTPSPEPPNNAGGDGVKSPKSVAASAGASSSM